MPTYRERNGQHQVQVRIQGHAPQTKTFRLKKDAIEWGLEAERRLKLHGMPVSRKVLEGTTLGQLIQRYIDQCLPQKKSGANEKVILTAFLNREPSLCRRSLAAVRREDFARYRDERMKAAKAVKSSTLRRELAPLRHMFQIAKYEWDLPVDNPLNGLKLPKEPPSRDRRLRGQEEWHLKKAALIGGRRAYRYLWECILELVLSTAMRRGEMLGLAWTDIDFERRTIAVRHSKSGRIRTLPMSKDAHHTLSVLRHNAENHSYTARILTKPHGKKGTMVTGVHAERKPLKDCLIRVVPLTPSAFEQSWKRLTRRAKIEGLTFHDLRHEAASRFDEIGLTNGETKYMLGHSQKDMTSRYIHADLERIRFKLDERHRIEATNQIEAESTRQRDRAAKVEALKQRYADNYPPNDSSDWNAFTLEEKLIVTMLKTEHSKAA